jgi:dihydropyrimidine dehydrogenase (NAD+) subunit PreA
MEAKGTGSDVGQDPDTVERYTRATRRGTHLPILAKMTPNITDMRVPAIAAIRGGANGIAAINTIKSITGVNIDTLVALPAVHGSSMLGGYSGVAVKPIALRFISEMATCPEIKGHHISGMGGIETWRDGLEFILLGAGSLQVTTAVMEYGYRIIDELKAGLNYYLAEKGIANVRDMRGLALESVSQTTDVLERDTVVFPKFNSEKCVGCGRCVIACADGGHQALNLNDDRKIMFNGNRCVGCHLCLLVCPQRAITSSHKRIHKK